MTPAVQIVVGIVAGLALAYVHSRSLSASVEWLAQRRAGPAVGLQLARFALLALALLGMAAIGAPLLIAAAGALVLGRAVFLRWLKDRLT